MKILEWFNSRDLSFPDLSSSDFETIINLPDFADNDFDMAIREVWGYLQYDEDSLGNYIPAEYFKDILYRAWNDLKLSIRISLFRNKTWRIFLDSMLRCRMENLYVM